MPPATDDIVMVASTTGTTARPKLVPWTQEKWIRAVQVKLISEPQGEADRLAVLTPFAPRRRTCSWPARLPAAPGRSVPPSMEPPRVLKWMAEHGATSYTAFEAIQDALIGAAKRDPESAAACRLRQIVTNTPAIAEALYATFGADVRTIYAMSEALNMAFAPESVVGGKPGRLGLPVPGADLAIHDPDGRALGVGAEGEIVVRGPNVFDGYLDDPEANAIAFRGGWFHTGDVGFFDPEGFLNLVGRIKEQINRGGDKISPLEVDEVLLQHPGVVDVATFAMPHKTLMEEVAAAVVRDTELVTEASIKDWAIDRLAPHKVPRRVVFVDAIPREAGKIQRVGLDQRLGLSTMRAAPVSLTPPADDVERRVAEIWRVLLEIERPLGREEDFFELGGDSLLGVQMLAAVDSAFSVQVPQSALVRSATLAAVSEAVRQYESAPPASSLVPIQPAGDRTPLFWVSGGRGGVFGVTNLSFHLGSDQPVYAFQPRGVDGKSAPVLDIREMAAAYVGLMRDVQAAGPYAVGGHSFGGLVAFEMARQLEESG